MLHGTLERPITHRSVMSALIICNWSLGLAYSLMFTFRNDLDLKKILNSVTHRAINTIMLMLL